MSRYSKLRRSRENWKQKTILNGKQLRYQRKELLRIKKERDKYKQEARKLKKQLKQRGPIQEMDKETLIYIALQIFLVVRISFRAVSRVLEVLSEYMGVKKAPCPQTVINWVSRLSIAKLQNVSQLAGPQITTDRFSNGLIWIIDISIGLGAGKILTVLGINANHYALNKNAPTLKDVHCLGVAVAVSWTGENIATFLQKIIGVLGRPTGYLKDGGTDLGKAARLLSERGLPSVCIDDVSHVIANLLKHEYENHPMFETFLSSCGTASKRLKQTILACLAPSKVSHKSRFMNLHRLVTWADQLLKHSPRGCSASGSIVSKLRNCLNDLPSCKAFIKRFLRDASPLLEGQKILKNKGLSTETYSECQKLLESIPAQSSVRRGFEAWAEEQLQLAKSIGQEKDGLPISTDILESLFGIIKKHGTGAIKDANRMALRLPALCGELTKEDAKKVRNISVEMQREIEGPLYSLTKQRRQVLPNPGKLELLDPNAEKQNLELIPRPKSRAKKPVKLNESIRLQKKEWPSDEQEKTGKITTHFDAIFA